MHNSPPRVIARRCARRRRALAPLAGEILRARGEGRDLAPAAWAAALGLAWLCARPAEAGWFLIPSLALFAGLCLLALFDARYFVIPDGPILFLALCGGATSLASAPEEAPGRLAAAAAGFVALQAVAHVYEKLRGTPGIGQGDARLLAVAGLWLGFGGLPSTLIYAVFSALVSSVVAMRRGSLTSAREPLPFGPHLALGLWLTWVLGPLEFGG